MLRSALILLSTMTYLVSVAQIPANTPVDLALNKLLQSSAMSGAKVSFVATNLDNGKVIADYNGAMSLTPASIQKLITTGVALEELGPDFQFETRIAADADLESGKVAGNIYVIASGDPTLQSSHYASDPKSITRFTEKFQNLSQFDGMLIIDASIMKKNLTPRGWVWEDMGNYFGATPSALIWRDNTLPVYLNSGQVGTPVLLSSRTKLMKGLDIELDIESSSTKRDDAWFFSAPGSSYIYGKGSIPSSQANFLVKASHPKPMHQFGTDYLKKIGFPNNEMRIDYDYIEHSNLSTIASVHSPPLYAIVKMTNLNSINLYAEALNIQLDKADRYKSVEGGIEAIEAHLKAKRVSSKGMTVIDGSGLSPLNRITGQTMTEFLTSMYRSSNKDYFINSLPVAGQSGTLAGYFKGSPLEGNVKAKSGTMAGVRNYAGYITNTTGETITFCLMINDYNSAKRTEVMNDIQALLEALMGY